MHRDDANALGIFVNANDFSLEVTGFMTAEIDLRVNSLEDQPAQDADPADVLPEVSAGPPVSKIGDAWLLGPG